MDANPTLNLPLRAKRSSAAPWKRVILGVSSISMALLRSTNCSISCWLKDLFAERRISLNVSAAPIPMRRWMNSLSALQSISFSAF